MPQIGETTARMPQINETASTSTRQDSGARQIGSLTHPNLRYIRCNIVESISIKRKRSRQMVRSSSAPFLSRDSESSSRWAL